MAAQNLVIVESPSKRKTIEAYLGPGWHVVASVGHIRDLPKTSMGVDLETFIPSYIATERGQEVIKTLKQKIAYTQTVWLATDLDREGEAIAWHLKVALGLKQYKRIIFNEITKDTILTAIKHPRQIDMNKVNAQQGRRILDRLIGYSVSPALNEATGLKLSAGRVQSPALRLIRERESEIETFKTTHHFGVELSFNTQQITWFARWNTSPFVTEDQPYFLHETIANRVAQVRELTITKRTDTQSKRYAPPPFITSTLQQAASVTLKLSADQTMKLAQTLYEAGHITYMRTDNPNLSNEAITAIYQFCQQQGQTDLLTSKPNTWKNKANAEESHEAIRPTNFACINPPNLHNSEALALYHLIRSRALACQMKPAVYDVKTLELQANHKVEGLNSKPVFIARSRTLVYPGWLTVAHHQGKEDTLAEGFQAQLPSLNQGDPCQATDGKVLKLKTNPPPRYTEASLIRRLERENIGRPSTYASIIKNILDRGYVKLLQRKFHLCDTGRIIVDTLKPGFSFIGLEYTRKLEQGLDNIAKGQTTYTDLVKQAYQVVCQEMQSLPIKNANHNYQCAQCKRPLKRIKGKKGFFWSCTGFRIKACQQTYSDHHGKPHIPTLETQSPCPVCHQPLVRRLNKQGTGYWWGCSAWKQGCKYTTTDLNGKPAQKK